MLVPNHSLPVQWEEVSGLDDESNSVRTYEICTLDRPSSHWLRTRWIPRRAATTLYVEIRFTMMECSGLNQRHCKETFNLYYYQSDSDEAGHAHTPVLDGEPVHQSVHGGGRPPAAAWRREALQPQAVSPGASEGGGALPGLPQPGRACMALLSVRVFYRKCPPLRRAFASFPETVPHSHWWSRCQLMYREEVLSFAQGVCVENAVTPPGEQSRLPSMLCGEDGQWVGQPTSSCACRPGYEAGETDVRCRACPSGQFKAESGPGGCGLCPAYSNTLIPGSSHCLCHPGYYRADSDPLHAACTRPPSPPRSIVSQINDTSVTLEWSEPLDRGGRGDLTYRVLCSFCGSTTATKVRHETRPGPQRPVRPEPQRLQRPVRPTTETTETRDQEDQNHRDQLQSLNGVSALSQSEPASDRVNVTTSRDVPPPVSGLRRAAASETSLSLEWNVPVLQNQYQILDYQLRYSPKEGEEAGQWQYVSSRSSSVVLTGLQRAAQYQVQVRTFRSQAGYGSFSTASTFNTLPDGVGHSHLVLTGVLVSMGILLLIAVVIVAVYCYRVSGCSLLLLASAEQWNTDLRVSVDSLLTDDDDNFDDDDDGGGGGGGVIVAMKVYIDPFTYEDPKRGGEGVRQRDRGVSSGRCVAVRLRVPGRKENYVAIKTLKGGYTEKQRRDFLSEASIMGQFQHPNIIHLEGVITTSCPVMILTEFMENGALDSFLRMNDGQFTSIQLVGMLRGIAAGMKYLSDMSFVHRDLAARNILVNSNLVCKVSDFGLSRFLTENSSDPTYTSSLIVGDIVGRWKKYFEDLLNPTDLPSNEEVEAGDSEVDSSITQAEVTEGAEGLWEFAQPVHMCFVDLEKAFDRVPRGILWGVLREYGVRGPLLRAVRSLYDQSRSLVRIAGNDVVLLASSSQDLQHVLERFAAECEAAGMRISTSKSEAMVLDWKRVACPLRVGGEVLPQVEEFKYLGVLFTSEGKMEREIDRRIGAASAVMRGVRFPFAGRLLRPSPIGSSRRPSDAWSYGIVMWEVMSYGERPYWDMSNQDVINAIEQDYRLPPPPDCPSSLHALMLDCWQKELNGPIGRGSATWWRALDRLIRNPASLKVTHSEGPRDLLRVGVTLAGHQKKILSSIQTLRIHKAPPTLLY
ncbi:hypothetical protein L3Q82_016374 [Scortum barcoo]|uniref:Uncharacterized protein n=1 Tax=Scortum barcoo TaxID=214431 RepID=A0ACB8X743_9TELE|nr:hypothetical protein L3Q82_016374 [Scortum barcoo]